jgi:DNA-binding MarR family transcriptional regulator
VSDRSLSDRSADPLDTSLLFDVFALNQAVGRLLADAMQDGPLTPAEYAVYSAIFELEAATPTRIAARLGMRLTTFMDQLRDITQRGHARRLPHPSDRRSYRVTLTAEGSAAHRAANERFERAHAAFDRALGEDARAAKSMLLALREAAVKAEPKVDAQRDAVERHPRAVGGDAPATRPCGGRAG